MLTDDAPDTPADDLEPAMEPDPTPDLDGRDEVLYPEWLERDLGGGPADRSMSELDAGWR